MNDAIRFPKTVYLLRHAHAAWARPGLRDFDRPLDQRGEADASTIASVIRDRGIAPELVLCSSAVRCNQTCDIISSALPPDTDIRLLESLYSDDYHHYVKQIASSRAQSVMIIGHNPMIEDTAIALAFTADEKAARRLQKGFPTAGLAIFETNRSEANAEKGGHLSELLSPKKASKLTNH